MMDVIKNDKGYEISGIKELISPEYGTGRFYKDGNPEVDWSHLQNADVNGFDVTNTEGNGDYIIEINLPRNSHIIRYGGDLGHFTAPKGTKYEELSMPYKKDSVEYNEYVVISDNITVFCRVTKGKVAPGFNSSGGAVQYFHKKNIRRCIRNKELKKV